MNTTNLFVELLVIGLGPIIAVLLLVLLVVGPDQILVAGALSTGSSLAVLLPLLGAAYLLGIIVDRVADRVFARFSPTLRYRFFADDQAYHEARRVIVYHSEAIYRIRQYGRSRMRICRGWAVNVALIAVPANLVLATAGVGGAGPWLVLNGLLVATLAGAIFSWRTLAESEYRKIKGSAEFIRARLPAGESVSSTEAERT